MKTWMKRPFLQLHPNALLEVGWSLLAGLIWQPNIHVFTAKTILCV